MRVLQKPTQDIYDNLSEMQHDAIDNLKAAFPDLSLKDIVEGPLAQQAVGKPAPWSNLKHHRLVDTMVANVGACVMCLYLDGPHDEIMIVLGQRPDPKNPGMTLINGSGGGFATLVQWEEDDEGNQMPIPGEQPAETAGREWKEENRKGKNMPVCDLSGNQKHLIDIGEGLDFRTVPDGGLPTAYFMHYTWLTDEQKAEVKAHAAAMEDDDYRHAAFVNSNGETANMGVMPLAEAADIPIERFAHPHECKAIRRLQKMYKVGKLEMA